MNREEYINNAKEICNLFVREVPIIPVTKYYEGRKNSEETEKNWLKKIKNKEFKYNNKKVKLIIPEKNDRFWVDFAFVYDNEFYPINFKSGAGRTDDNISGLKYLRYLIFYDVNSEFKVRGLRNEDKFSKKIILLLKGQEEFDNHNRDYFCLSHCTDDNSVRIVPIGCIHKDDLKVNPKNLFQVNFHTCRLVNRTLKEMVSFIIKKYIEYQRKRAGAYLIFKEEGFDENSEITL